MNTQQGVVHVQHSIILNDWYETMAVVAARSITVFQDVAMF